jgi:hypothetical protein
VVKPSARYGLQLLLHAMGARSALPPKLYFPYAQFMVYDRDVRNPSCAWTDQHSAQGFARCESAVNFGTSPEFRYAEVTVSRTPYQPSEEYERVISVPFLVTSGKAVVEGPEETDVERSVTLAPGNYRLATTQRVIGEEKGGHRLVLFCLWQGL